MKHVEEYILKHPEAKEALAKANKNPHLVERIVSLFKSEKFNLPAEENPFAEETERLNITEQDARILAKYYEYCSKIEKEEMKAYKKAHPYASSFYDGVIPSIDMKDIV